MQAELVSRTEQRLAGGQIQAQGRQAAHGGLLAGLAFDIRQKRRAGFGGAGFGLLDALVGKLDIGVAFRRNGQFHGAFQGKMQRSPFRDAALPPTRRVGRPE